MENVSKPQKIQQHLQTSQHSIDILDTQAIHDSASNVYDSQKSNEVAQKSTDEPELFSMTSVERVSPLIPNDEVFIKLN